MHLNFRKQKANNEVQQIIKSGVSHVALLSSSIANERQDDQDCLFLSGVRLHLCCCTPEEQLQLVRIAREGCALRHTDLSPGLTHIVVSIMFIRLVSCSAVTVVHPAAATMHACSFMCAFTQRYML